MECVYGVNLVTLDLLCLFGLPDPTGWAKAIWRTGARCSRFQGQVLSLVWLGHRCRDSKHTQYTQW